MQSHSKNASPGITDLEEKIFKNSHPGKNSVPEQKLRADQTFSIRYLGKFISGYLPFSFTDTQR